jgi:hypothetical protein
MDPNQVKRGPDGVMQCIQCGFRYDLNPTQVAERAEAGIEAVRQAVADTPMERRSRRPAPDVWSVNGYTRHLADATGVILQRIDLILAENHPFLPYWDEAADAEAKKIDDSPADDSIPVLAEGVRVFGARMRALPADAWNRVGIHERAGEVRLSEIALDMAHEIEHHAQDIRDVGSA